MRLLTIFCLAMLMTMNINAQGTFAPPATPKKPVTDKVHGFEITDLFRWLENKEDPEVIKWSHDQHNATVEFIKKMPEILNLKENIKAYLDRDYEGAPFFVGKREFFYKRLKGEPQSKLYTKYGKKIYVIFDPTGIDPSGKSAISGTDFTEDGNTLAIGIQNKGNEINDYRIVDTKTGKIKGDVLKDVYSFSWTKDEKHAYITIRNQEIIKKQEPLKTYLYKIGDDFDKMEFIIAPKDAKDVASVWDTEEGGLTFYSEGDFYSNSLRVKKTGSKDEPKLIYSSKKFKANPTVKNNKIFIMTNDNAPNFKLMITDIDKPEKENWKEFYPEKETVLESFVITKDYVIIKDKKDVIGRLTAYDMIGNKIKEIELPEIADVSGISFHKESNTVFVSLNTFTSTTKVFKLDGSKLTWEFFYQDRPPVDTKDIESKQVFYYSKDSTKIPMFLVYKKGLKLDGTNPTLLYGYGGFNVPMTPGFVGNTANFINRGGVYAIACLRGGNEYGENWHLNGMLFKKQNTFDDYISAAEYLINEKYTNSGKLACKGGSNGGLLIGAVVMQRPDLFKAAICAVPLLDMLRYHKFLIARYWIPEYGDPEKKEDFLNILKYSPYHNIRKGFSYPTMMVKAGENDARVDPLHAKKFAAALQNNAGQTNPILLYVDFESGHGSGQSVDQQVENTELEWRFLMNNLGMK